jgi:phospholipid/cholesterol/gamma-HCH transport system permease protein
MANPVVSAARPLGEFFAMCLDTARAVVQWPFQWREFVQQVWFIVSVSLGPTFLVSIPFTVLVQFQFNQVLQEVGAMDLSGAGAGLAAVTQIGPVVTTLIVAGAGATAICGDLGARKIREEIDAMEVLGVDPVHRLVLPRVLASMFCALFLNGVVIFVGLAGGLLFSSLVQGADPGQFIYSLPTLVGIPDLILSAAKAVTFGMIAGLIGCYRGLSVKGGPKAVGNAVNETVVYCFMMLFVVNVVLTSLSFSLGLVGSSS